MADLLIRGLDDRTRRLLRARAKRNGRSLQQEVRIILESAAGSDPAAVRAMCARWKRRFAGRTLTPSIDLLRGHKSG